MSFGDWLRTARGGMSRSRLAARCREISPSIRGIHEASIKFWEDETGARVPSIGQFVVLADACSLPDGERLAALDLARAREAAARASRPLDL